VIQNLKKKMQDVLVVSNETSLYQSDSGISPPVISGDQGLSGHQTQSIHLCVHNDARFMAQFGWNSVRQNGMELSKTYPCPVCKGTEG